MKSKKFPLFAVMSRYRDFLRVNQINIYILYVLSYFPSLQKEKNKSSLLYSHFSLNNLLHVQPDLTGLHVYFSANQRAGNVAATSGLITSWTKQQPLWLAEVQEGSRHKMAAQSFNIIIVIMAFLWIISCLAFVSAAYGETHTLLFLPVSVCKIKINFTFMMDWTLVAEVVSEESYFCLLLQH